MGSSRFFLRAFCVVFCFSGLLLGSHKALAKDPEAAGEPDRPKIGLVLSGGGARGAAHIGVLKILEENRIPVDMIAGTSFGAIVGGLYAAGYSADDLDKTLADIDWSVVLSNRAPRDQRSFRRKQDDNGFLIKFKLGLKNGDLTLPSGLITPNNLRLLLRNLVGEKADVRDFEDLATPFRAVATDLTTGDAVVLQQGDLAAAIVASMAVPALFPPVEHNGLLLVDGGVANNVPIDVVRSMGADIVIVVDISSPMKTKEELASITSVISQLTLIMTSRNTTAQLSTLGEEDIVIRPELDDIKLVDFDRTGDAVDAGERAAQNRQGDLQRLSLPAPQWQTHLLARRLEPTDPPVIDFVRINNTSKISDNVIRAWLSTKPGDVFDVEKMTEDLTKLYGMEIFDEVTYRQVKEDDLTGIEVRARGQERGNSTIRFGLTLQEDFEGESGYQLAAGFNNLVMNSRGGEIQALFKVGDDFGLFTEFYQPLDYRERYYLFTNISGRKVNENILDDDGQGDLLAQVRITSGSIELGAGRNFGNWATLRLGLKREYARIRGRIGIPDNVSVPIDVTSFTSQFSIDTLDNIRFPHSGTAFEVAYKNNLSLLNGDNRVDSVMIAGYTPFSWGKNTIGFNYRLATSFNGTPNETNLFKLGGFLNLTAYVDGQLTGNHGGSVAAAYYRRIGGTSTGFLGRTPIYVGGSLEAGNVWNRRSDVSLGDLRWSSSLFVGADSILGPVYLGAGIGSDDQYAAFLYVGQLF